MQRITWYAPLAIVALMVPIAGQAQAPQAQIPHANVHELGTLESGDDPSDCEITPNGRVVFYVVGPKEDTTYVYEIATKRRSVLGTDMVPQSVSSQGDRLAFTRHSEDGAQNFVWTIPIDPRTGVATGQAQRVSVRPSRGWRPTFSPDGKTIAFNSPRPDGSYDVTLVPTMGGPERVIANYPPRRPEFGWSADGKSLYVRSYGDPGRVERIPVAGGPREVLVPRMSPDASVVGFSADRRVAFFRHGAGRFSYRTASNVEGDVSLPTPLDSGWGYTLTLDSTLHYKMIGRLQPRGTWKIFEIDFNPALQAIVKR